MNCTQAQEKIYAAEVLAEDALTSDLRAHLQGCADCQALLLNLQQIESAAKTLPAPAGTNAAKEAFLAQLQPPASRMRIGWPTRLPSLRSPHLRNPWTLAAAASIVLLLSAGAWLLIEHFQTKPPQVEAASVVDRLVDFNVELADAATPDERNQIFTAQAAALKQTFEDASLPADERELGAKLMENGVWFSMNNDPLASAEKFSDLADILLTRMKAAQAAGQTQKVARLSRLYGVVQAAGVDPQLKLAETAGLKNPELAKRHAFMLRRNADLEQKFQDLVARSPEMSRRQINQELKQIRQTWLERRRARLRQQGQ